MINFFKNFSKDESGAVTVDWVVLTAAVVALAVGAFSLIGGEVTNITDGIVETLQDVETAPNTGS